MAVPVTTSVRFWGVSFGTVWKHSKSLARPYSVHIESEYPFVGGHEVIGRVAAAGDHVPDLHEGDLVGLGWTSRSCMHCDRCIAGDHNLCLSASEEGSLEKVAGKFDLILNTTDAELPWDTYIAALAPRGTLHTVGAAPSITATVFPMIMGQKSLSSSPTGSIATTRTMLDFVARHKISPMTEVFPMSDINEAFTKLREGSPRYRLVLVR